MPDDRPQDVGRSHKRKRTLSTADAALLDRWHATLRYELEACISELAGVTEAAGILPGVEPITRRPSLADRARLIELGIRVGNALGSAIDPLPPASSSANVTGPGPRRRSGVEF